MAFYESIFIIRQDVSSADVDKIRDNFTKIAQDNGSKIVKTEYWGLRTLAYEISNNKKGHYVFLGLESNPNAIKEIERRMKLSDNIIRFFTIKVDAISDDHSPILKGKSLENEEVVDVSINKDFI